MSIHISSIVWRLRGISSTQKLILLKLADCSNDNGESWPSLVTISDETGLAKSAVCRHLKEMENAKILSREPGRKKSTVYTIHVSQLVLLEDSASPPQGQSSTRTVLQEDSQGSSRRTVLVLQEDTNRKEPSIEPSVLKGAPEKVAAPKKKREPFDALKAFELPFASEAFSSAWSDWCAHRKEKRIPLTKTSTKQQFEKLKEMGEARAIAAIRHSIANGYQGVFEPNNYNKTQTLTERHYDKSKGW